MQKPRALPSRIGITGSPATGKKTIGTELAKITGSELLEINKFVIKHKLAVKRDGEFIVNTRKVGKLIDTNEKIVCGHLLPYVIPKSKLDFVIVLRCSPRTLKKRYLERGYSPRKITENVEAEMIGVIAEKALTEYGQAKVIEFDTTRTKNAKKVAKRILKMIQNNRIPRFGKVDWLSSQRSSKALIESLRA